MACPRGGRYWYSSGKEKNTSGDGILTSQLTYSNLTGGSGKSASVAGIKADTINVARSRCLLCAYMATAE